MFTIQPVAPVIEKGSAKNVKKKINTDRILSPESGKEKKVNSNHILFPESGTDVMVARSPVNLTSPTHVAE